jgi:hypothetical protein
VDVRAASAPVKRTGSRRREGLEDAADARACAATDADRLREKYTSGGMVVVVATLKQAYASIPVRRPATSVKSLTLKARRQGGSRRWGDSVEDPGARPPQLQLANGEAGTFRGRRSSDDEIKKMNRRTEWSAVRVGNRRVSSRGRR